MCSTDIQNPYPPRTKTKSNSAISDSVTITPAPEMPSSRSPDPGPGSVPISPLQSNPSSMSMASAKLPDTTSKNPNRRSNKPIMEKRRRARINNCLNELKAILLDAMKKDPARHSKLEKADILELTVSHLKELHRNSTTSGSKNNNETENAMKYRAGFLQCVSEVETFINSKAETKFDPQLSCRLLAHLADCLNNVTVASNQQTPSSVKQLSSPGLAGNSDSMEATQQPAATPTLISLVPSRLPTGEIAFILPGFNSSSSQQQQQQSLPCNLLIQSDDIQYYERSTPSATATSRSEALEVIVSSTTNQQHNGHSLRSSNCYRSNSSSPSSSSTLSSSSLSPASYPSTSSSSYQNKQFYSGSQHQGPPPPPAHLNYSGSFSHYNNNNNKFLPQYYPIDDGQPLALVKVKNELFQDEQMATDLSCWRPW